MDGSGETGTPRRGRPPVRRLRAEISFGDLPDGARRRVLEAYRQMWGL